MSKAGKLRGNSRRACLNWTVLDRNRLPSARQIEVFRESESFATMHSPSLTVNPLDYQPFAEAPTGFASARQCRGCGRRPSRIRPRSSEGVDKVRECFTSSHRLLLNQTLGTAEYEAILQALGSTDPDIVIDIKYIRHGFKYAWLRESAMRLALAKQLYDARLKRHTVPLLLVILSVEEVSQQSKVQELREKAQTNLRQRGVGVRIEYIREAAISNMPCNELKRLILG